MSTVTSSTKPSRVGRRAALGAAGALALVGAVAAPASAETEVDRPDSFTSAFTATATPEAVVDGEGNPAPGPDGAMGTFTFMINSDEEIICYDIETTGVTGEYESPAKTATHIHQANLGEGGPPRLAFPNPMGEGDVRTSSGCFQGPFTTGLEGDDGNDTGEGFSLAEIEANPAGFSADTHTADFLPGAVRGQLESIPVGGVETGFGGTAERSGGINPALTGVGIGAVALGLLGAGAVVARRQTGA